MVFTVIACDDTEDPVDPVTYTVTFNTNEGSAVASIDVEENDKVTKPADPTKEGFTFEYWYTTDEAVEFDFNTAITADITLNALWEENVPDGPTDAELIALDIESIEENLYASEFQLNLPTRGPNGSRIAWKTNADNVSFYGNILPLYHQSESQTQQIQATFSLGEEKVVKMIDVTIPAYTPVVIDTVRTVDFTNLTTEYDVADGNIDLYFEADGNVPYVSVVDFLNLLEGFVDPDVEFTITEGIDTLEIFYQYYDSDYDETYDLIVTLNDTTDTITTNDPGFYWAYVYSTETNYGRHIEYDYDNPDASFDEGDDVIYDLSDYNLEITSYNNDILLPYYIVNQLFAGSSYYNVYYNQDGLFGIYSLPSAGTDEYVEMKTSSVNGEDLPVDLAIHNFNMLAFNLDNFYGLQDIVNVETYKDLLMDNLDSMLTTDARQFDNALFNFIYKTMDELHTSYGYPSYYNDVEWDGPVLSSVGQLGSRGQAWYGGTGYSDGLFNVQDLINATWTSEALRPNYWFLDDAKTSVVITLDGFVTADIEESATYDAMIASDVFDIVDITTVLPNITAGNKFFYYNSSDDKDQMMEIIIKGATLADLTAYGQALETFGYTYQMDETNTNSSKDNGYYEITVGDASYMVQLAFDEDYDLLYISIVDRVPDTFQGSWPLYIDVQGLVNSDSAVFLEMVFDKILVESPTLENVTLDLTYNTGGNVGALYRVVGFVTDQPFKVSGIDGDTGGASTSYVLINGTPTYPNLNWSLLTSKVTFSAANSLATIFMENDLGPIMGIKSGGGASSITPILLPTGTAFTMSSNNISAYRTGTGTTEDPYVYHSVEFGVDPDHVLDISDLYDEDVILQILNS
jgi:uncharacterized repeat protein (TIGR02543 family)